MTTIPRVRRAYKIVANACYRCGPLYGLTWLGTMYPGAVVRLEFELGSGADGGWHSPRGTCGICLRCGWTGAPRDTDAAAQVWAQGSVEAQAFRREYGLEPLAGAPPPPEDA